MDKAVVIGTLWASQKSEGLTGYKLTLLSILDKNDLLTERIVVAVDILDISPGDSVLVSYGSGARNILGDQMLPIDAAIAGIIAEDNAVKG